MGQSIYIKAKTKTEYNKLMNLALSAGYTWPGDGPKDREYWEIHREQTVVLFKISDIGSRKLAFDNVFSIMEHGLQEETIPELSEIKTIVKVSHDNWDSFRETYCNAVTVNGNSMLALSNGAPIS